MLCFSCVGLGLRPIWLPVVGGSACPQQPLDGDTAASSASHAGSSPGLQSTAFLPRVPPECPQFLPEGPLSPPPQRSRAPPSPPSPDKSGPAEPSPEDQQSAGAAAPGCPPPPPTAPLPTPDGPPSALPDRHAAEPPAAASRLSLLPTHPLLDPDRQPAAPAAHVHATGPAAAANGRSHDPHLAPELSPHIAPGQADIVAPWAMDAGDDAHKQPRLSPTNGLLEATLRRARPSDSADATASPSSSTAYSDSRVSSAASPPLPPVDRSPPSPSIFAATVRVPRSDLAPAPDQETVPDRDLASVESRPVVPATDVTVQAAGAVAPVGGGPGLHAHVQAQRGPPVGDVPDLLAHATARSLWAPVEANAVARGRALGHHPVPPAPDGDVALGDAHVPDPRLWSPTDSSGSALWSLESGSPTNSEGLSGVGGSQRDLLVSPEAGAGDGERGRVGERESWPQGSRGEGREARGPPYIQDLSPIRPPKPLTATIHLAVPVVDGHEDSPGSSASRVGHAAAQQIPGMAQATGTLPVLRFRKVRPGPRGQQPQQRLALRSVSGSSGSCCLCCKGQPVVPVPPIRAPLASWRDLHLEPCSLGTTGSW